jgi:hypothetical protein
MKKTIRHFSIIVAAALFTFGAENSFAQVASGGGYTLNQSVIASGGGQNSAGGVFTLEGTIGQPATGMPSTGTGFSVSSGFWTVVPLAPTAANVSVSGRVLTANGSGLRNARVILTRSTGESLSAITSAFGFFRFSDVPSGEVVIISVVSKRYTFAPQILNLLEDIEGLNFNAVEPF